MNKKLLIKALEKLKRRHDSTCDIADCQYPECSCGAESLNDEIDEIIKSIK